MTTTHPQPLTSEELAAMKARVEKATPGPWRGICVKWPKEDDETAANVYYGLYIPGGTGSLANAELLGEARQDLPRLIAEVEALRGALEFYANIENWHPKKCREVDYVINDEGDRARQALGQEGGC